jgi:hypothetical protein
MLAVSKIDMKDLEELGVKRGHRKVLLEAIGEIVISKEDMDSSRTKSVKMYRNGDVIHEGFLQKKGRGLTHGWKLRYFDLTMTVSFFLSSFNLLSVISIHVYQSFILIKIFDCRIHPTHTTCRLESTSDGSTGKTERIC